MRYKITFLTIFFTLFILDVFAQNRMNGTEIVCPADPSYHPFFVNPPEKYLRYLNSAVDTRTFQSNSTTSNATFVVTYNGFSDDAQAAFQKAVDIWASIIHSEVTIYIDATWTTLSSNVLGSAGPSALYRDFEGAPYANTWYPVTLAEKISRTDINEPGEADITARFNSSFDWYLGTDGNPGSKYDFVTVVLHEIAHGLGFACYSTAYSSGTGYWLSSGYPAMYAPYIVDGDGVKLEDLDDESSETGTFLTSADLYLDNELAVIANGNVLPKIYAPSTYSSGSSISHWDDNTFDGTENALMTHAVAAGESILDPGPNTLSVLADMGWVTSGYVYDPIAITNVNEPFIINAKIFSDTTIATNELVVKYFYEGTTDTLSVSMAEVSTNSFEASITLDDQYTALNYYITGLTDDLNKSYSSPQNISEGIYSVTLKSYSLLTAPYTPEDGGSFELNQADFSASSSNNTYELWELGVTTGEFASLNSSTVWKTNLDGSIGQPETATSNYLFSQFFDLSDTTRDYVLKFDYALDVDYDGQLSVVASTDSSKTVTVIGAEAGDLGTNWYDSEGYFGTSTLDDSGNFELVSVEYPLYELAGKKSLLGFLFYVSGIYSTSSVYEVEGALIDNFEIEVNDPQARFYAEASSLFPGEEVQFYYASNGAESFSWDFGDGGTSTERNPVHVYDSGGYYDVTLTIGYDGGSDTQTRTDYVRLLGNKGSNYTLEDGGNMEINQEDFIADNISGTTLSLGESTITGKAGTHSGSDAWVFGMDDSKYVNDSEAYLYTSEFDFTYLGTYTMSFYAQYSFEEAWDGFIVEYTTDRGETWTKVNDAVEDGWYDELSEDGAVFGDGVAIFTGSTNDEFVEKTVDLSDLAGSGTISFRFTILTDSYVTDVGLALDDFTLTGPEGGELAADLAMELVSGDTGCDGQILQFTSNSSGWIVSMEWDFGDFATPATASGLGPHVVVFSEGTSEVKLIITDSDSLTSEKDTTVVTDADFDLSITTENNENGSFTLSATEGDTYQWYQDEEVIEGATEQSYTTFENGDYSVQVTLGACTKESDTETLTVAGLVQADLNLYMAPNPVVSQVTIGNSSLYTQAYVRLVDLTGRTLLEKSYVDIHSDIQVDLSSVKKGTYLLQIIFDQKYQFGRMVIKD